VIDALGFVPEQEPDEPDQAGKAFPVRQQQPPES